MVHAGSNDEPAVVFIRGVLGVHASSIRVAAPMYMRVLHNDRSYSNVCASEGKHQCCAEVCVEAHTA